MGESLLPTPSSRPFEHSSPEAWRARRERERGLGRNGNGFGLTTAMAVSELTSASSQASEDWTSPSKPSATDASDRSRSMSGAVPNSPDTGRLFPVGEMSPRSGLLPTPQTFDQFPWEGQTLTERGPKQGMLGHHVASLTSSAEGSPASPSATPAAGRDRPTPAGSGLSSPVWLASYDRESSSWRTSQVSFLSTEDERFPRWWETWPRWAMWDATGLYGLPMSALPTDGSGSSSSPTPTAQDGANTAGPSQYDRHSLSLNTVVTVLPTPNVSDKQGVTRTPIHGKPFSQLRNVIDQLGDHTSPPSEDGSG